jgi:TonB-dependent starch-binding outer membrane protein SusC
MKKPHPFRLFYFPMLNVVTTLTLLLMLLISSNLFSQTDKKIMGKVTDSKGETIPGASVKIKNTTIGIATDVDGKFTLNSPDNAILVVTSVGFDDQENAVNGRSEINIVMKTNTKELQEVVVVGYGSQRKVDITGATASVKGEEMVKQPVLTATQAVQGKMAGVQIINNGQPGTSPVVRIRGTGTALAGTATLFVVDGVLTDDIANINTADIVNLDVLKDASATAIYGSRGANGVIIITTKKGAVGDLKVNYTMNAGMRSAANLVKMATAEEYANYVSAASGNIIAAGTTSTNWYNQILRNAWQQTHNLSLSGGNEKSTYFISGGYLSDEGIVIGNKYDRYTLRANNDFTVSNKIKVGIVSSYTASTNQNVNLGGAYNDSYRAAPIIPSIVNGKYGNTSVYQNVGNPILDIQNSDDKTLENRLQGNFYAEYKPIEWLTFRSGIGGDWVNQNQRVYGKKFNNDTTTFITPGGNQRNPNSTLSNYSGKSFRWTWDNTVTFNKTFDKHTFTILAGTTAEQYTQSYLRAFRKDVPADPNLWYIGTGNANTSTNDGGGDKWARNSYIGRINYNFNDRYLLTATIRADGSSRFPSNNRWAYFPSFGAGWVISSESFMQNQTIFQTLKLRASWGKVGNDRIPSDAYTVTVTPNLAYPYSGGTATIGSAITEIKDPNLKWETTTETDFGIEFSALKGKLTGELGNYNKTARDLLINVKVPSVTGDADGQVLTNAASIQNVGFEGTLRWRAKINDALSYFIGGNITFNDNKVVGLNGGQPILDGGIGANQQYTTKTDNGQPVGSFYVLQVLGVFQNDGEISAYKSANGQVIQPSANVGEFKYQDTNGDGRIDDNDRVFVGSYQPKAYYGINAGLNYKSLDLSIDVIGNTGNQVYNGKKAFRQGVQDNVESALAYTRWTPSNGSQTEPAANGGNLPPSTYFVESGSFIRLNNVTIGYTLPKNLLEKIKVSNIRVFMTAQNAYTYKKYSGFTAELPGNPTSSGIELNAYPTTKTFALGLNVGF